MSEDASLLDSSSNTLSASTRNNHQQRGKKRQCDSNSENHSIQGGSIPKGSSQVKLSNMPETPNKPANPVEELVKPCSETASQKKPEKIMPDADEPVPSVRGDKPVPRPLGPIHSYHLKPCGKAPCYCARCKGRHVRRMDIVQEHMTKWPSKAEEKLHKEKRLLQRETKKLADENKILAVQLKAAMKEIDDLNNQAKKCIQEKLDIKKQLRADNALFQRELEITLRNEQAAPARDCDSSSQVAPRFECSICFEEVEGGYSRKKGKRSGGGELKQRACFRPCNHAGACTECAVDIWNKTNKCPFCETKLSGKPAAIHF
ncbi:hypothetical protein CY35_02G195900 [Sphagnum magellanicum]|nr:hypothetical protein CY35_02G195900 [Sphagnum magellanicum]